MQPHLNIVPTLSLYLCNAPSFDNYSTHDSTSGSYTFCQQSTVEHKSMARNPKSSRSRGQKQALPKSEIRENRAPLTPTNGFATHSENPLATHFTRSDGHRSKPSLPVEKHLEGSNPIAKVMAPTTQHGSCSSNYGLADEHQPSPKNESLRDYWAEVVENNEFSLAKQFRQFYHVHDITPNESQQDQAGLLSSYIFRTVLTWA